MLSRRQFLVSACALTGAASLPWWLHATDRENSWLVSAYSNQDNQHFAAAFDLSGNLINQVQLPARGHGPVAHPLKPGHAIINARRPGTYLIEVDFNQGLISQQIKAEQSHHFFGHGVFSRDGKLLFSIENNFEQGHGEVVVRDSINYQVLERYHAGGVGPHECKLMPDGNTLVIANGGIKTHPSMPRKKLNLDSMSPALTYLDLNSGQVIDQYRLDNHQLSIRHLDVSSSGKVVAGLQYQGAKTDQVPLAISHQGQDQLSFFHADEQVWRQMNQYTASVCINNTSNTVAISCPRGDIITLWDLKTDRFIEQIKMRDVAGLSVVKQQFVATNGKGTVLQPRLARAQQHRHQFTNVRWDNHLTSVKAV